MRTLLEISQLPVHCLYTVQYNCRPHLKNSDNATKATVPMSFCSSSNTFSCLNLTEHKPSRWQIRSCSYESLWKLLEKQPVLFWYKNSLDKTHHAGLCTECSGNNKWNVSSIKFSTYYIKKACCGAAVLLWRQWDKSSNQSSSVKIPSAIIYFFWRLVVNVMNTVIRSSIAFDGAGHFEILCFHNASCFFALCIW